eukprot:TRINITY_DN72402_c0_g1_i1.p1 TRINITY_DN72402_c0_g1~~TRINITY_DN72402_c0_g1_i1.p1  ORF type:complete len:319 (+),score=92.32 TRINITY_DN72402_c0_g1_i1:60-959(+)
MVGQGRPARGRDEGGPPDDKAAALDLLCRLPPRRTGETLGRIARLRPDLADAVLSEVEQPLRAVRCDASGRDFVACDRNRHASSFRSPWSNAYCPPDPDGPLPSYRLRRMEEAANDLFAGYAEAYFDSGAVASCYFWDTEDGEGDELGFAMAALIHKVASGAGPRGGWDSVHVVTVTETKGEKRQHFDYRVTSSLLLHAAAQDGGPALQLAGRVSGSHRVNELAAEDDNAHVGNIGRLVQERENLMRSALDQVHFSKALEVSASLRSQHSLSALAPQVGLAAELRAAIAPSKAKDPSWT